MGAGSCKLCHIVHIQLWRPFPAVSTHPLMFISPWQCLFRTLKQIVVIPKSHHTNYSDSSFAKYQPCGLNQSGWINASTSHQAIEKWTRTCIWRTIRDSEWNEYPLHYTTNEHIREITKYTCLHSYTGPHEAFQQPAQSVTAVVRIHGVTVKSADRSMDRPAEGQTGDGNGLLYTDPLCLSRKSRGNP